MKPALVLLVLALWLGGALLMAAAVAPAAFAVLPTRALAGALVGRVLLVVFWTGIVAGLLAAALAWTDRAAPWAVPRALGAAVVALACAVAQLGIAPRIQRLRAEIGPSLDALAPDDARRVAFGRLHGISVLWMGVAMLAAGVVVALTIVAHRPRA